MFVPDHALTLNVHLHLLGKILQIFVDFVLSDSSKMSLVRVGWLSYFISRLSFYSRGETTQLWYGNAIAVMNYMQFHNNVHII